MTTDDKPAFDDWVPVRWERKAFNESYMIVRQDQRDGSVRWAVEDRFSNVLNTLGTWEWQPSPSNRDAEFLARARFTTQEAAAQAFNVWCAREALDLMLQQSRAALSSSRPGHE